MANRGYNTFHGFDSGPPPPSFNPQQGAGQPQYPMWPTTQPVAQQWPAAPAPYLYYPPAPAFSAIQYPTPPWQEFGNGSGGQPNYPDIPGVKLKNHLGGEGLPPGYDYLFPQKHARIHVFKTKERPWQMRVPLLPFAVPVNPECKFVKVRHPFFLRIPLQENGRG
jgi:hypothetical protein